MAGSYELEGKILELIYVTVFSYEGKAATVYVTVCDDVGTADNQVLKCVTFAVVNVEFDCSATV